MTLARTIHDVQQGTPAWLALRAGYFTASEAPAMMGVSKYVSRTELLRRKATGAAEEVGAAKQALFDRGHAAEAAARPLIEAELGEDLFPVTATVEVDGLRLLASLDGLTMAEDLVWECKLWNEELAAAVRAGSLPPHYIVQLDQELLVSGAARCRFTVSDGTPERTVSCWYESSEEKFAALIAGWQQFARDVAAYVPPAPAEAVATPVVETLPAVAIRLDGALAVQSNLPAFGVALRAFVERLPAKPSTDSEFALADAAVKALGRAEEMLDAAEATALASIADVVEMQRVVADLRQLARSTRLDLTRLVDKRKAEIKDGIILAARGAFTQHVAALNVELAPLSLTVAAPDFAAAAKGKRTVQTLQDAVDTALARGKIAADQAAREWREKLAWFRAEHQEHAFLFADPQQLVGKPVEDFRLAVAARIDAHTKAEEDKRQREAAAARIAQEALQVTAAPKAAPAAAPTPAAAPVAPPWQEPAAPVAPTLKLGVICERLGFTMTAAFVADVLGVQPAATEKAAKLYTEAQFGEICRALIEHVADVAEQHAAA
ncbi:MAG: hypothetical protein RIS88_2757 [Pseudomonadota bacterium]|jgi:putative phage-type endonuclease